MLLLSQNGGNGSRPEAESLASGDSSAESVFTPGTERRLERLPALLAAPAHDVYLGGSFPVSHQPFFSTMLLFDSFGILKIVLLFNVVYN